MGDLQKVVATKTDGWQAQSAEWALARVPFKIRGIKARHLAFCKEICEKHNYRFTYDSNDKEFAGIFVPEGTDRRL